MPITQARMLALIAAADDLQRGLERAIRYVEEAVIAVQGGASSADELSILQINMTFGALVSYPTETIATIAVERRHFQSAKSRNEAAAKWQEQRRRDLGMSRRDTAPLPTLRPSLPPSARPGLQVRGQASSQSNSRIDLSRDETDPDSNISEALFASSGQGNFENISPHDKQRLYREGCVFNAPKDHYSSILDSTSSESNDGGDLIGCECGFKGSFTDWQGHLTGGEEAKSQTNSKEGN